MTTKYSMNVSVDGVNVKHEDKTITEKDVGNEHITTVIRDVDENGVHIHEEQIITDMEADNFHKVVTTTTTVSAEGEKTTTKVTTDKDLDGEHIHTEMIMDENGVKDVTLIEAKDKETVKVVDKIAGNSKVHKEVVDKEVEGVHVHEELKVTEQDVGSEHVTTVVRDTDEGDKHVHSEARVTDMEADNYHKEVINTTTSTPAGEKHETRVTTDKDVGGEHIHKESHFRTKDADHLVVADVTVVSNSETKEITSVLEKVDGDKKIHQEIVDKEVDGVPVHEELKVVEENDGTSCTTRSVRDADAGGAHVHIETKVTDTAAENFHKEVINTSTSGTLGETHVTRVITDKDLAGNHIHTEMVMDGKTATDVCVINSEKGVTEVVDRVAAGEKVHSETIVRMVDGKPVSEKVTVSDKNTDGKHTRTIVRDADSENRHVHSEATVTEVESENYSKEVINTTISTPEGETHETRVVTDRDINNEHIHTETIIDEDGVREATVIENPDEVSAIVDQEHGGVKVHKEVVEKIVDGQKVTEKVKVIERGSGANHVTTIVRDVECGDNQFHAEAVVTDLETDNFHKEVLKTTTTTPSSETHVTRITTDKDVDGQHVHTESIIDGDGVREATLIERSNNEFAAVVDESNNGISVHKEVVEKVVDGKPIKDEIEVVEKDVGTEHRTTIVRDAQRGQCSVHAETVVTDVDEENFQKKVIKTTKTTPAGEIHETRVVTDKDVGGEHIHTEMTTKKDALGNITCEDATVIETKDGTATVIDTTTADKKEHKEVVDSSLDGVRTREEVKVTQRDVGSEHITEVVKDVDKGEDVHVHEETTIIDDGEFRREVKNKHKTTPEGEVRMCHVTTDNVIDGERIHKETLDEDGPDGHIVKDFTVVNPAA
eukprot:TRINITY_DN30_c0_g1_i9.p1 TRINITY_DN30_c0_g1~~TRINITY_DN30_c0_g1_i9.p1  ORF type:complete len:888 (+),score=264.74 TRINITY_DN30_c0_g1_i9:87-2750(+)